MNRFIEYGAVTLQLRNSVIHTLLEVLAPEQVAMRQRLRDAPRGHRSTSIAMTPDDWEWLLGYILPHSYTAVGQPAEVRRRAGRLAKFRSRLTRELARMGAHPAYKGRAVLGVHTDILSAWRCTRYPNRFYTTHHQARSTCTLPERGYLIPRLVKLGGKDITMWDWSLTPMRGYAARRPIIIDDPIREQDR